MAEHRPYFAVRCGRCECDMEEQDFRVAAISNDGHGRCLRVESSVWVCPECKRREGRSERWIPVDCEDSVVDVPTAPVQRIVPARYVYPRSYHKNGHNRRNGT